MLNGAVAPFCLFRTSAVSKLSVELLIVVDGLGAIGNSKTTALLAYLWLIGSAVLDLAGLFVGSLKDKFMEESEMIENVAPFSPAQGKPSSTRNKVGNLLLSSGMRLLPS